MEGNRHLTIVYQLKADTKTSYYYMEGAENIFPRRVTFSEKYITQSIDKFKKPACGEFNATYTKSEQSAYRTSKGTLHSLITPVAGNQKIIGTGDLEGANDLLIFEDRSAGKWQTIAIHIFPGCKFKAAEILSCFK